MATAPEAFQGNKFLIPSAYDTGWGGGANLTGKHQDFSKSKDLHNQLHSNIKFFELPKSPDLKELSFFRQIRMRLYKFSGWSKNL